MLKIKNVFYMFFFSVLLVGCTEEIDYRQVKNIQGLIYKVNEKDPFSGRVLNYRINSIGIPSSAVCKADIKNGMPDGSIECTRDNVIIYTGKYIAGKRDGAEHVFSETGAKVSSSKWKGGVKNGVERKYNKENELLISEATYLNGKKDGVEKAWAKDGKTEIANLVWKDEKQTGFRVEGYGDHINYLNGQYHGLIKKVSVFDGNQLFLGAEINYKNGEKDGAETVYIAPDKIEKSNTYKDGLLLNGKIYLYESYGKGDVIGEFHVARVNNPVENADDKSVVVYDGKQKGTNEAGNLMYEVDWDKGRLVKAEAFQYVNGESVLVYRGLYLYDGLATYESSYSAKIYKTGIENVFQGNEFVGQVAWDEGELVAYAIKYNKLYSDKKESNDFIIIKPNNEYIAYKSDDFMNPTVFKVIDDRYTNLYDGDILGIEKLESYQDSFLNTDTFKNFKSKGY